LRVDQRRVSTAFNAFRLNETQLNFASAPINLDDDMNADDVTSIIESPYRWLRLTISLVVSTIGGIGMWSAVVALPAVQADFGIDRASASLPFTFAFSGYAFGGALMGRLADRLGIVTPLTIGAVMVGLGYISSSFSVAGWQYAIAYGVIGLGSSAAFAPLMADISHWFTRQRGMTVAIVSCGSYLAGTIWPPAIEYALTSLGWRQTHALIGVLSMATILPLTFLALRPRAPTLHANAVDAVYDGAQPAFGLSPNALQATLMIAGVCCCVTMATPQVQIVAYCGDLGYGPARGAQMLSLMMGLGIVSRLLAGSVADRLGGLTTLAILSTLQAVSTIPFILFDDLAALYAMSGIFGLFHGGLIPMYTVTVREYFSPHEAGVRVGMVLGATLLGMAVGGWLSGVIFDLTGSYPATFINAVIWNLFNLVILLWLLSRGRRTRMFATEAAVRAAS
jgi:MFS family permease